MSALRVVLLSGIVAFAGGCASPGINAGHQGGRAFIAFTFMLLGTLAVLWFAVGRGD